MQRRPMGGRAKPTTGCKSEGGCSSTDYDVYYLAYRLFWY